MPKEATPVRRQYLHIKQQYPDALLLFRLGDFYEAFEEDAKVLAKELQIVLTSRGMGKGQRLPMAGIPYHALDNYLAKLIRVGYKVAICEQMGQPGKGLVPREVTRVVTPGTVLEPGLLESKVNNYLASWIEGEEVGLAYADVTTGEFVTGQLSPSVALAELERLQPSEVLCPGPASLPFPLTSIEEIDLEGARDVLSGHLGAATLDALGCAHQPLALEAAAAILLYLGQSRKSALAHLGRLTTYQPANYVALDPATYRHLELFPGPRGGLSLFSVLDRTQTAMGARLLRQWLGQPLRDMEELLRRQGGVGWFYDHALPRAKAISLLKDMADLERLINRIRSQLSTPREVKLLDRSLGLVPSLMEVLSSELGIGLSPCSQVVELIQGALDEEGNIKAGFSPGLDELRVTIQKAKDYLANLERQEREATGVKSLRVAYNQVFGYYIEVTRPHLSRVPGHYIRKQTLSGGERFITPELKEYEALILNSRERMEELEADLFRQVCHQIALDAESILETARSLARIDVLSALAEVAVRNNYARPLLSQDSRIDIQGGRHPVVEAALRDGFISNDVHLSNDDAQLLVITGPNMSGKSTYIRQVALIVLLAQIGSFVPAESAQIGLVDRIFTRVGLQDDITSGRSTFMVEMVETARILHNATPRSLIVLDEIGRGTSTYDGISIARAVAEYIHNNPQLRAKTLFATHYHELVDLARYLPRVRNFQMAVMEEAERVIFLRKVVPGGANKSYGIHVAQLAGLPRGVVNRAHEILKELEADRSKPRRSRPQPQAQIPLLPSPSPLVEEVLKMDLDSLTPIEALTKLYELKKKASEDEKGKPTKIV